MMLLSILNCLTLAAVAVAHKNTSGAGLTVSTSTGTFVGLINGTAPDVRQFLSVPFAQPPIGERRWLPPAALPRNSTVVKDATQFPPACPQFLSSAPNIFNTLVPESGIRSPGQNATAGAYANGSDEDCLYLAVWTPAKIQKKLPVIMFMTGGGFSIGGINIPYQLPYHWVQRSQSHIVVTINYRVDIMGFPNAPGLEDNNLGLLDQRAALEWVRDNIEAFGGDSDRITLWGQSAGAFSVEYQSFIRTDDPIAAGYVQTSGTAFVPGFATTDSTHSTFNAVSQQVGCGTTIASNSTAGNVTSPEAELACMRKVPVSEIVTAASTLPGVYFLPVVDNKTVFSNYTDLYVKGQFSKRPAIVSYCENDGLAIAPYPANGAAPPSESSITAITDNEFHCPAVHSARLRSQFVNATYRYEFVGNFSNISPVPWLGAYHDSDLAFLMGTEGDFNGADTPYEAQVAVRMQDYLLAFITDPECLVDMGWPQVSSGQQLKFGDADGSVQETVELAAVDQVCVALGVN